MQDSLSAHSASEQAQDAVANGFDTIFVCGGDGTILQVIQGVAGSEVALGVIPLGTGNVLAQNLRLPRDPMAAARAQMHAPAISIPLGKIVCRDSGPWQRQKLVLYDRSRHGRTCGADESGPDWNG